jgi:hypothetical protein
VTSPDTWTAPDWREFGWFGVCDCGRLRHEHAVLDDAGALIDLTLRCGAGHEANLDDV